MEILTLADLKNKEKSACVLFENRENFLLEFGEFEGQKLRWIIYDFDMSRKQVSIVSKYAIKEVKYHFEEALCDWGCTGLFEWLNEDFYKELAESCQVLKNIVVSNTAQVNMEHVWTAVSCNEKIRILTFDECKLMSEDEKICYCSDNPEKKVFWWIKRDLCTGKNAVNTQGNIVENHFTDRDCYVRPALTLDLSKLE